jgi:predicted unusual protein kinase regulating ubiquinone biosynthesis (AarF/ABC1/UbiB family)
MRNATGLEVLRQMLQTGTYQSDPNLGNFLVGRDDGIVYWVDYGSMESLTADDGRLLAEMLNTVVTRNILIVGKHISSDEKLSSELARLVSDETRDRQAEPKIAAWLADRKGGFSVENIEVLLRDFQDLCASENYVLNPQ